MPTEYRDLETIADDIGLGERWDSAYDKLVDIVEQESVPAGPEGDRPTSPDVSQPRSWLVTDAEVGPTLTVFDPDANAWDTVSATTVEDLHTEGDVGTVPVAQSDGTLAMAMAGGFENIEVFESDGSFDASGVTSAKVLVVGGGGGGGGGSPSANTGLAGGGGGGGGFGLSILDLAAEESVSVTVGTGGAGGAAEAEGSAGGASSFGSFVDAAGGGGGGADFMEAEGGDGGSATAQVTVPGQKGMDPLPVSDNSDLAIDTATGGAGGDSPLGHGASPMNIYNAMGRNGQPYGGGGGGGVNNSSGGDGADGVVIVFY